MKVVRRLFIVVLILVIVLVLAGGSLRYASKQRPDWYATAVAPMDAEAQAQAAQRAQDQLARATTWAARTQGVQQREKTGTPPTIDPTTGKPDAPPDNRLAIRFTEQELNALFNTWKNEGEFDWDGQFGKLVSQPAVAVHDGHLILAGLVKDFDVVASLHFKPTITADGKLDLRLERVMAGSVPMPQATYQSYRQRAIAQLEANLPNDQRAAKLHADGTVNTPAISAAMSQLAIDALSDRPGEAILFIEADLKQHRSVPIRVDAITIQDKAIDLTVEVLTPGERAEFVKRVRGPFAAEPVASRSE